MTQEQQKEAIRLLRIAFGYDPVFDQDGLELERLQCQISGWLGAVDPQPAETDEKLRCLACDQVIKGHGTTMGARYVAKRIPKEKDTTGEGEGDGMKIPVQLYKDLRRYLELRSRSHYPCPPPDMIRGKELPCVVGDDYVCQVCAMNTAKMLLKEMDKVTAKYEDN